MQHLRYFREKNSLTQIVLADRIGIAEMTIRRWESGLREPRASDITKLCEILGCSEGELINGPTPSELKIVIDWEVNEGMSTIAIGSDSIFFGYRSSDDSLLFSGAVPAEMPIDEILGRIKGEIEAARAGRNAHRAARESRKE